jgi:hypothetical protein
MLEGTSAGTDNVWFACMVDDLLHSLVCADHVCAVDASNFNLLIVLVEFAVVEAWARAFLDAGAVVHDSSSGALATLVTGCTAEYWACSYMARSHLGHVVASSMAETLGWLEWMCAY